MKLTARNIQILKIIIDEYIQTGWVIWSKMLLKKYDLWVSSATVRWDMAKLEKLDLIYQPYNSAWRMPTSKWLRAFVNYLMWDIPNHFLKWDNVELKDKNIKTIEDYIHKITHELSNNTKEISFLILPEKNILIYSWVANFLRKNHKKLWDKIYPIIDMLEDKHNFIKFINTHNMHFWVNVFIWDENILPYLKDFTLIIKPIHINWEIGYVWLVWTLQMDYAFNISAIKWII